MPGVSRSVGVSEQYAAYIEELHELFANRNVSFGTPADLIAFAQRLRESEFFADEMGSMARSILFREDESLSTGGLLDVVTVAVAGADAENAVPEVRDAVRAIFAFLHGAVREAHYLPEEAEENESERPLTAGDILATGFDPLADPGARVGEHIAGLWSPPAGEAPPRREDLYSRAVMQSGMDEAAEETPVRTNAGLKAHSGPAVAVEQDEEREERSMAQGWLIPAVAAGLAVIGVGAYIARPGTMHRAASPVASAGGTAPLSAVPGSGACVAPMQAGTSLPSLQERWHWAQGLADQKLFDAELPALKQIAQLDPGFPGIQLQQSEALMNLKRPEEAREAIDNQIATSECLARLPAPQLDAYCSTQFASTSGQGCREQLLHVRRAAQLQAALIHLELGHRVDSDSLSSVPDMDPVSAPVPSPVGTTPTPAGKPGAAESGTSRAVHRTQPLPPASEGDTAQPPLPKRDSGASRAVPGRRRTDDDSLRKGDGTDSVFGAYQKPE